MPGLADAIEAAFLAARRCGGFGIRVSPNGATAARYAIPSQRMVPRFLERVLTISGK